MHSTMQPGGARGTSNGISVPYSFTNCRVYSVASLADEKSVCTLKILKTKIISLSSGVGKRPYFLFPHRVNLFAANEHVGFSTLLYQQASGCKA